MTFVVPFDGSELARAALVRATRFATALEEDVLAVSVVPEDNASYAQDHGWLEEDESFDVATVVSRLHRQVTEIAPSADYRHKVVGKYASPGQIATRLRQVARDEAASMVFVGSENAGRLITSLSSVAERVASGDAYDVVLVRHADPLDIDGLDRRVDDRDPKSDFYLPE
jgi:nucleotide-binding universal stress UspA family protein